MVNVFTQLLNIGLFAQIPFPDKITPPIPYLLWQYIKAIHKERGVLQSSTPLSFMNSSD